MRYLAVCVRSMLYDVGCLSAPHPMITQRHSMPIYGEQHIPPRGCYCPLCIQAHDSLSNYQPRAQVYVCDICSLSCKEPFLQQYRHLLLLIWQEGSWHHHPGIGMHLLPQKERSA